MILSLVKKVGAFSLPMAKKVFDYLPEQIATTESSIGDPIFYYIKSSHDCPCAYHDQLRRIDEERATLKRSKKATTSSNETKGSFYIPSNSSSTLSLSLADDATSNPSAHELHRLALTYFIE